MKLIEAKNISYKINDRNILNNISFVIDFGELVKISGDNGSGKTTLLKIIIKSNRMPIFKFVLLFSYSSLTKVIKFFIII